MKKLKTLFEKHRFFLCVLCALVLLSLITTKAKAQCTDTLATLPGGKVKFVGVNYYYGSSGKTSTWFYEIQVYSTSADWSHVTFQLGTCVTSSVWGGGGTWSGTISSPTLKTNSCFTLGYDNSDPTNPWSGKYGCQFNKGGTYKVYFILKADYGVTSNEFKAKPGKNFDSAQLCGPNIICDKVPVTLGYFDVVHQNNKDVLKWVTYNELNNEGFDIEISTNGLIWQKIGTVAGKGNSSQRVDYSFTFNPYEYGGKKRFYRLKQVDYNGKFEYSAIKSVSGQPVWGIYPNPASEGEVVSISAENFSDETENTIRITNATGKIVFQTRFTGPNNLIEITNLTAGAYIIQAVSGYFVKNEKLFVK